MNQIKQFSSSSLLSTVLPYICEGECVFKLRCCGAIATADSKACEHYRNPGGTTKRKFVRAPQPGIDPKFLQSGAAFVSHVIAIVIP